MIAALGRLRLRLSRGGDGFVMRLAGVTAALTVGGALCGLARDQLLARLFGADGDTDAFLVAWTIPEVAATLLIEDAMALVLVPAFALALAGGHAEVRRLAAATFPRLLLALAVGAAALAAAAGPLVRALAPGLADPALAVDCTRLTAASVLTFGVAGYLSALLRAHRSFVPPAAIYIAYNVGIIALALSLGEAWGVRAAAAGVAAGGVLMVLLQLPFALRRLRAPDAAPGPQRRWRRIPLPLPLPLMRSPGDDAPRAPGGEGDVARSPSAAPRRSRGRGSGSEPVDDASPALRGGELAGDTGGAGLMPRGDGSAVGGEVSPSSPAGDPGKEARRAPDGGEPSDATARPRLGPAAARADGGEDRGAHRQGQHQHQHQHHSVPDEHGERVRFGRCADGEPVQGPTAQPRREARGQDAAATPRCGASGELGDAAATRQSVGGRARGGPCPPSARGAAAGLGAGLGVVAPVACFALTRQSQVLVERFLGSSLSPGAISCLNFAQKVAQIPMVLSMMICTVTLPIVARALAEGDAERARQRVERDLTLAAAVVLAGASYVVACAPQIIEILFQRGEFGADATAATAGVMRVYALGLLGHTLVGTLVRPFFSGACAAHRPTWFPMAAMGVGLLLTAVAGLAAVRLAGWGAPGLAAANAAGISLTAYLLLRGLRARVVRVGLRAVLARLAWLVLAAGLAALAGWHAAGLSGSPVAACLLGAVAVAAVFAAVAACQPLLPSGHPKHPGQPPSGSEIPTHDDDPHDADDRVGPARA